MARSDSTREMGYSEPSNRLEMERERRRQRMRSVSRGVSRMMIPTNRPIRQFDDTVNNKVIFLKWNSGRVTRDFRMNLKIILILVTFDVTQPSQEIFLILLFWFHWLILQYLHTIMLYQKTILRPTLIALMDSICKLTLKHIKYVYVSFNMLTYLYAKE